MKTLKTLKKIPLFKEILTVLGAVILLLLNSCAKDLSIGGDLVEGDKLNIKFTDTTTVQYSTETLDSALSFSINGVRTNLFLGNYNDPIFGKSNVELVTELVAPSGTPLANVVSIDSVMFSLAYDSVNCVGDLSRNFTVELHRLRDSLLIDSKLYTNRVAATQSLIRTASGANSHTFIPNTGDRRKPIATVDTTALAYLNWKLDTTFGRLLFNIVATRGSLDFASEFKGLVLKGVGETASMLSLNMLSQNASRVVVFYSYRDTTIKQAAYSFNFNGVRYNYMKHDYTGKRVGEALGNIAKGDSAFYLQGLAGVNAKVTFPFAQRLGKVAINKAELEWTLDLTDASLPNVSSIIIAERDLVGNFLLISDSEDASSFGGVVTDVAVNGRVVKKIKTNITKHYQSVVNGTGAKELYILPQSKLSMAGRTVLYGAKHRVYPAKLNITYTKLD